MQGMEHTFCSFAANSVESTRLHFSGDLTWWLAAILAAVGGLVAGNFLPTEALLIWLVIGLYLRMVQQEG